MRTQEKRFAFDDISDAALKAEAAALVSTADGVIEYSGGGDFARVALPGIPPADRVEFFRVPAANDEFTLHAKGGGGQFARFQNGWQGQISRKPFPIRSKRRYG